MFSKRAKRQPRPTMLQNLGNPYIQGTTVPCDNNLLLDGTTEMSDWGNMQRKKTGGRMEFLFFIFSTLSTRSPNPTSCNTSRRLQSPDTKESCHLLNACPSDTDMPRPTENIFKYEQLSGLPNTGGWVTPIRQFLVWPY